MPNRDPFIRKYDATPFDPSDRQEALAENARKILVGAFLESVDGVSAEDGDDLRYILGGLLVGLACVMSSHMRADDQSHAALRSSLIEMTPWAVDMMRSIYDLRPLPEA